MEWNDRELSVRHPLSLVRGLAFIPMMECLVIRVPLMTVDSSEDGLYSANECRSTRTGQCRVALSRVLRNGSGVSSVV